MKSRRIDTTWEDEPTPAPHQQPWFRSTLVLGTALAVSLFTTNAILASTDSLEVIDDRHVQKIEHTVPFAPGMTLDIDNTNGKISVISWNRPEASIRATKRMEVPVDGVGWLKNTFGAPVTVTPEMQAYFDRVEIQLNDRDGNVEVMTIVPSTKPGALVTVDYEIRLPRDANLQLNTLNGPIAVVSIDGHVSSNSSNGKVSCENVTGPVELWTGNGGVYCRKVRGPITARTSNGPILINSMGATAAHAIDCETVNGQIKVSMPGNAAFNLRANTQNGYIKTAFAVDATDGGSSVKHLNGRVGAGGPEITLRTANGSILLGGI